MSYELFDPTNACNPILPLNEVSNNVTFYKIIGLDYSLNDIDLAKTNPFDLNRSVRLGLPLGLIFPNSRVYDTTSYTQTQKFSIEVGKEGIFYPFKKSTKFNFRDIVLSDIDIQNLHFKKDGIDLKLNKEQVAEVLEDGVSIVKTADSIYQIRKAQTDFFIKDSILEGKGITIGGSNLKLSSAQITELKTKGKLSVASNGNNLNLEYITPTNTKLLKSTLNSSALSHITPMSMSECRDFARTIYPTNKMDDESYEDFLGELYLCPFFGKTKNEKYGISSGNLFFKRFLAGLPERGFATGFPYNVGLWDPLDLNTLERFISRERRYMDYIAKHDIQPKDETTPRRTTPTPRKNIKTFQFPRYEMGVFTTYNQEWKLLGYSRGSLLSSLTLAPKEELAIEITTYDRHKIENERSLTTEVEFNSDITSMVKTSTKVMNELVDTTDAKIGLGLGVPVPAGSLPVEIKGDGSLNKNIKDTLTNSVETISDLTQKASEKLKSISQVKITQSHEFGEEKKVIRKIVNPNNSRTLTFNHFEIVENYSVTTTHKATDLQPCLLIDNPFSRVPIDLDFILAYEDKLSKSLLSNVYIAGFEAAKKLAAQRWFDNKKAADLILQKLAEEAAAANPNAAPKEIEKNIVRYAKQMRDTLETFLDVDIPWAAWTIFQEINPFESNKPSEAQLSRAEKAFGLASFWFKFRMAYPTIESKARAFLDALPPDPDENTAFIELEKLVSGLDDEWLSSLKLIAIDIIAGVVIGLLVGPQMVLAAAALAPIIGQLLMDKNEGLPNLIDRIKKEVRTYQQLHSAVSPPVITDPAAVLPQEEKLFTANEFAAAYAEFEKLVLHLEVNKAFYMNKIWLNEDPDVRFSRLKVQGLDKFVENKILGFVGMKAAFFLRLESLPDDYKEFIETKVLNAPKSPGSAPKNPVITQISVPTSGVYMESMLGKCDALEPNIIERMELEKEMTRIQNEMAREKLVQLKLENEKLQKSINGTGN